MEGDPHGACDVGEENARQDPPRVVALGTTVARTLEYYAKTGKTEGEDDIFIYPGFEFKIVDALLTNFHAPKSTVLMLASAFAGWDNLKNAYDHAIKAEYNFLSYGDSMLIC
jgi:S-adenosylmethionine:tRNA ribosyltransferase-isomerase